MTTVPPIAVETGIAPSDVLALLAELPKWFGRPQSSLAYAHDARRLACVTCRVDGRLVGIVSLKPSTAVACEIAVMAVAPALHRLGIGRALTERALLWMKEHGYRLALVQTVGPADPSEEYARTRAFYGAVGFLPVIELPGHFGADTPALIMVRPLHWARDGGTK